MCLQAAALIALQEDADAYLVQLLEDVSLCMIHTKKVIIMPWDIQLDRMFH